jgi:hypothetical protein
MTTLQCNVPSANAEDGTLLQLASLIIIIIIIIMIL